MAPGSTERWQGPRVRDSARGEGEGRRDPRHSRRRHRSLPNAPPRKRRHRPLPRQPRRRRHNAAREGQLHLAVKNCPKTLVELLKRGADPLQTDDSGDTALYLVAKQLYSGSQPPDSTLLKAGASDNAFGAEKMTPLMLFSHLVLEPLPSVRM